MLMKTAWSGFLSILVWVLMKPSQPKSIHSPICVSETFESNYEYLVHLVEKAGRNVGVTAATVSLYFRKVSRIVSVVLLALTILSVGIGYEISVNNQSADPANVESLSLWSQRACRDALSHGEFYNTTPTPRQVQVLMVAPANDSVTDGYNCKAKVWIGFKKKPKTTIAGGDNLTTSRSCWRCS